MMRSARTQCARRKERKKNTQPLVTTLYNMEERRIRRLSGEKVKLGYNNDLDGASFIPLNLAIQNGAFGVVKSMIQKGVNVNGPGCPLRLALERRMIDIAYLLFLHGARIEARQPSSAQPLHMLCEFGLKNKETACKFAEELILQGANMQAVSMNSGPGLQNPMSIAVQKRFAEMIWILVAFGGNPNPGFGVLVEKDEGNEKVSHKEVMAALENKWSPKTHKRYPKPIRDSIVSFLLVAKRLNLPLDSQISLKICSFVAYAWLIK
eukprot:Phypoly_transcript_14378.p1 GENE.Phypoly_transcript_14378~~Phypoly_transcript_14378.p1  ORF type:complete len:265 (+),score=40.52 Phypoly_transcript_14378:82-876(+)